MVKEYVNYAENQLSELHFSLNALKNHSYYVSPRRIAMYKVRGKVLVKGTAIGIPNLQVVLYDLDKSQQIQGSPTHVEGSQTSAEVFPDPKNPDPRLFWQLLPGDRIGSVLTDGQGEFELTFDEQTFQAREQTERPDLVLFVIAPEDTQVDDKGNSLLVPDLTTKRILHYSYDIVVNAGRSEQYIIRLPQASLDRFQIPYSSPRTEVTAPTIESVTSDLQKSFKFEQGIQAILRTQTQERLKPAIESKKKAEQAFQNFTLSRVPPEVRASNTYFTPGEKILDKLLDLFSDRLANLPTIDRGAKRKLVLHLSEDQLEAWGLAINDGTVNGEVALSEIVEYIRDTTGGGTLEYSRPVLENCQKEKEAERLFEEALERCRVGSNEESEEPQPNLEPPESSDLTTSSLLHKQLARQMKYTTSPEEELKYGVERDGEIVATITKPSPADVTAYHDFYELQIAFEHVWTEVFDKSMPSFLRSVYSEMVRYKNRVSGEKELPPVQTVQDMRSLYADFVEMQETIESVNLAPPEEIESVPPSVKTVLPEIIDEDWSTMTDSEQTALLRLGEEEVAEYAAWDRYNKSSDIQYDSSEGPFGRNGYNARRSRYTTGRDLRRANALRILQAAQTRPRRSTEPTIPPRTRRQLTNTRLKQLMQELDQRLAERYQFDIFAPNSVNYGLMLTYRQKWVPGNYQVGDLVSTIPLAPKEIRKYSTKQVIKKSRSQKEIEDAQSTRSAESSSTSRADTEITKQAREKTSFEANASGTVTVGVFTGEFGTRFGVEAEKTSSSTKKNFREAVLKASEEYKQQRRLEIETSITEEIEVTNSGEIMNPNDEITVTYLFYELQRQYEISERIHRLTPVVLVANDVPHPDEIDEDWLIAHDWILRRVILDDSFLPALSYVTTSIAGDELALQALRDNVNRQIDLVTELTKQVQTKTYLANEAFKALKRLMDVTISTPDDAAKLKDIGMAMVFGPFSLAAGGGDDEAAEKREEIAKMALERSDQATQEVSAKLSREVTALQEAIDKYTRALQEHFDRQTAIARLRIHIKENIFYYMQAIWDYEPPDQRFFRLYNIEVPWIELQETTARVRASGRRVGDRDGLRFAPVDKPLYEVELSIPVAYFTQTPKKLSQVADLDNLLGYKGNYMIFPATQANYLHTYMMQDYIDPQTGGLRDPDEFSNYTTEELLEYVCCLQKGAPEVFAEYREYLLNLVKKRMTTPRKESELVVVPTGSAYIEALPGKHPILEDFKLVHRALDVKKVQAEVRNAELENVRLAARLLEGEREDPDIDKRIIIEGNSEDIIIPPEA